MSKPDYKLLTWGDYFIPVPLWADWLAMNRDGRWCIYEDKPEKDLGFGTWLPKLFTKSGLLLPGQYYSDPLKILPPGPWAEQLYWIG